MSATEGNELIESDAEADAPLLVNDDEYYASLTTALPPTLNGQSRFEQREGAYHEESGITTRSFALDPDPAEEKKEVAPPKPSKKTQKLKTQQQHTAQKLAMLVAQNRMRELIKDVQWSRPKSRFCVWLHVEKYDSREVSVWANEWLRLMHPIRLLVTLVTGTLEKRDVIQGELRNHLKTFEQFEHCMNVVYLPQDTTLHSQLAMVLAYLEVPPPETPPTEEADTPPPELFVYRSHLNDRCPTYRFAGNVERAFLRGDPLPPSVVTLSDLRMFVDKIQRAHVIPYTERIWGWWTSERTTPLELKTKLTWKKTSAEDAARGMFRPGTCGVVTKEGLFGSLKKQQGDVAMIDKLLVLRHELARGGVK